MREITPIDTLDATVDVPGSKSLTQRALIAAALAQGESTLIGPLASDDTAYTIKALRQMGIAVDDSDPSSWVVQGSGGKIARPEEDIFLGNNGTATRFLTSVAALGQGRFRITGGDRMAERPIDPLIHALRGWQVQIQSEAANGCPPLSIDANGLAGGETILPEGKSSQYLSSLLLVAPYAAKKANLKVEGEVFSKPYVKMTLAVMVDFGVWAEVAPALNYFKIPQGVYQGTEYRIEGDASGASYFWAAAAVTGGKVNVANVPVPSLQGDAQLVPLLERMGCQVERCQGGITVLGSKQLRGIEVDMGNMPDVAPTLAVVAAFAQGTTVINNIAHLRIKECDRLAVMVKELRKMGADVEEEDDRMIIHGQAGGTNLHGADIATYEDHRIAMCFAVAGLQVAGVKVHGEDCVAKSFPDFWERFEGMVG
ncbi:MAG: 3-phosphoshikimate 1-carboxyvinyltransferase [Candidatus Electrothrix sp. AW1]|nr:3-phosphoshikimate 1-carboxyvinyltransferase [Candidatus Electrothrix sp. AX1]MCI5181829.1 3-phosphoshikimate 1-carboxyvinyltransferase [Candidatus Electrothrix gigas]